MPERRTDLLALVTALDEGGVLTATSLILSDPSPDYDRLEALGRYLGILNDATRVPTTTAWRRSAGTSASSTTRASGGSPT